MTHEEQALKVGKIVLELKAKKRELVCLKRRADDIAERLESAASVLKTGYGRVPVKIHHHPDGPIIEHEAEWVRAEAINDLLEKIGNTTKEVTSLKKICEEIDITH